MGEALDCIRQYLVLRVFKRSCAFVGALARTIRPIEGARKLIVLTGAHAPIWCVFLIFMLAIANSFVFAAPNVVMVAIAALCRTSSQGVPPC